MDIRAGSERVKEGGLKRPLGEEPAFKRLLEILKTQDPKRTQKLMEELEQTDG